VTSPDGGSPSGAISSLASFANTTEDQWKSVYEGPLSVLTTFDDLFSGITGAISNLFAPLFGSGGSQESRGFDEPPPMTVAPSGVISSLEYLGDQVVTLQNGAIVEGIVNDDVWIMPPKAKTVEIVVVGGSGGGGRGSRNTNEDSSAGLSSNVSNFGAGGGGGGYSRELFNAVDLPSQLVIDIGLGGAGGAGDGSAAVMGGNGVGTYVRRPDGSVVIATGGGNGGGSGYADAPSDVTKGVGGFGNQGAFSAGGNGGQGEGIAGILVGFCLNAAGPGITVTGVPARFTWPQAGGIGPYSPGGAAPTGFPGAPGNPGVVPQWFPLTVGPGSGASGGNYSVGDGVKGGQGGHGSWWGSGGGGGGSSHGNPDEQNPGNGGHGAQGAVFIITRFS
jgi:hypothetical protein